MTDKEINKEISYHTGCTAPCRGKGPEYWDGKKWGYKCPNYVNDLNAMRLAEIWLSDSMYDAYWNHIVYICVRDGYERMNSASARQRAEAMLRSFGMWKEEA